MNALMSFAFSRPRGCGTTVAGVLIGLVLTLCPPIQADWQIESSRTYSADQKRVAHPCCPEVVLGVVPTDTPAYFCPFYVNNFKKKDRGQVTAFVGVIGLDSAEIQAELFTLGGVEDNYWDYCVVWELPDENCLVVVEFTLQGFPKLRKKKNLTDAFTAGLVVVPVEEGSTALNRKDLAQSLRDRLTDPTGRSVLPRGRERETTTEEER